MFPLNSPFKQRAKHICQNVVLKPKATAEAADPIQPCTSAHSTLGRGKAYNDQHGLSPNSI